MPRSDWSIHNHVIFTMFLIGRLNSRGNHAELAMSERTLILKDFYSMQEDCCVADYLVLQRAAMCVE